MDIRKKISEFLTITCTSFTVILLLYCVLWGKGGVYPVTLYRLCALCAMIGGVVTLTGFLPLQSDAVKLAIYFAEEFVIVFFVGGLAMKLFPFDLIILLAVLGMSAAAYLCVVAAIIVNEKICSEEINKKLAQMKKRK